jgi:hypothetical protein
LEQIPGFLDLGGNFWQIGDFQWAAELLHHLDQGNVVKIQMVVDQLKIQSGPVKGLFYEINVPVFQFLCIYLILQIFKKMTNNDHIKLH